MHTPLSLFSLRGIRDPFPGNLKILFVGEIHSTHAQSWIGLLEGESFNLRCFQLTPVLPQTHFVHPTYVPLNALRGEGGVGRAVNFVGRAALHAGQRVWPGFQNYYRELCLARLILAWKPDIVHTFALTPTGELYSRTRHRFGLACHARWVLQLRGGSDLALNHAQPTRGPILAAVAAEADAIVMDNTVNLEYLNRLGVDTDSQRCLIAPGTGGVDVDRLSSSWSAKPSARRLIVWPKAYESIWSKGLPVLEALRYAWDRISPCHIHLLATSEEIRDWINLCPGAMREAVSIFPRVDRAETLGMLASARVMLAPSLIDGTPNSMWEAMALGAVPIVSPLSTITPLVSEGENVLFARNLYPTEIGDQLARAMNDDQLVDKMAENNLSVVRRLANRAEIRSRVIALYRSLCTGKIDPPGLPQISHHDEFHQSRRERQLAGS